MSTFSENFIITNPKAAETTATTGSTSAAVDCQGYDAVTFIRKVGDVRVCTIEVSDTGATATDFTALATPTVTTTATGQTVVLEVIKPVQRFLRLVVGTGTTAVYGECYAIRSGARNLPVSSVSAATDGFKVARAITPT